LRTGSEGRFRKDSFRGGGVVGGPRLIDVFGGTRGGVSSTSGIGEPGAGVGPSAGERIGDKGRVGLNDAFSDCQVGREAESGHAGIGDRTGDSARRSG